MRLSLSALISRTIFVAVLTPLFFSTDFVQSTHSKYALAQNLNVDEPLCYVQTTNGSKINLGSLCGGTSQNIPRTVFNTQQSLSIENVRITSETIGNKKKFYVTGSIKNQGTQTQSYIEVFYQSYKQTDGELKATESNKVFVENIRLQPGGITTFEGELRRYPKLLMLTSLDSVEEGSSALNICYAKSVENENLCKRLSPNSIRRFN